MPHGGHGPGCEDGEDSLIHGLLEGGGPECVEHKDTADDVGFVTAQFFH